MSELFDALVIGGGPAGATVALLLARAGWSVMVLERKEFPRRKVCGEYMSATNWPLLEHLGIAQVFEKLAGPPVRRVGLFAGASITSAQLPQPPGAVTRWGRALSREHLDALLLSQAARAGAEVRQPCSAAQLALDGDLYRCEVRDSSGTHLLRSRLVIAAHGSWEPGTLPTQPARQPGGPCDLLGFKAHFRGSNLPEGLMPLLAFPGGYGGMVHCDAGRVSLSCCVRRDQLARIRRHEQGEAGEAVLSHVLDSCLGVRRALAWAQREGAWLAAGPIRPGIHLASPPGVFRVGNAAGEAHPVVAEGISMAMQSAWLLAERLGACRGGELSPARLHAVASDYARAWRRSFASRVYASAALAQWAMRPTVVAGSMPFIRRFPNLLSWGARCSGKATRVVTG